MNMTKYVAQDKVSKTYFNPRRQGLRPLLDAQLYESETEAINSVNRYYVIHNIPESSVLEYYDIITINEAQDFEIINGVVSS